jgi:hypothetical protein
MLLCDREWREAMTGTISLYDRHGERLHTIYVGAAPEYGKATFFERTTREINHVKSCIPKHVTRASRTGLQRIGIF